MPARRARDDFRAAQARFAAHLRNPRKFPRPAGIEPRRMRVYAELFFNNVEGFLAKAFPVLRKITPQRRWRAMARDFFERHHSKNPQFHGIAAEFLDYLRDERGRPPGDPPYLYELAHYEWVELALAVADEDAGPSRADPNGDLMAGVPLLSPLAWPLSYDWPVHRIGPGFRDRKPPTEASHFVVYRDRGDEVRFLQVNTVIARLLQLMQPGRGTGRRLVRRIARELRHPDADAVVAQGAQMLDDLRQKGIVLGTRR